MDVTNIILKLESTITSTPIDQQVISKAIQLLKLGAVEMVSYYTDLPDYKTNAGKMYYVLRDGLYWASNDGWSLLYLDEINSIVTWGWNEFGGLGNGTSVARSSPVSVVGNFTDWTQITAGGYLPGSVFDPETTYTLAIKTNGTMWSWGFNCQGQLGIGSTGSRCSPVSVVGGFTDWCQVSTKKEHTVALRTNGTAWAWGANSYGRLGDGSITSRSSPVSVVGGITNWRQVSAGVCHSLGLRADGTAWAWGRNTDGRLGDGTTVSKSSPIAVVGGFTDWCQISAGYCHSLGLRTNGTAWAWGAGTCGVLGDDTAVSKCSPVSVVGGFTDWCQVSAGFEHNLGLRCNGTIWSWGCNTCALDGGALGDGTKVTRSSPVSVVGGFTDWCRVSAGYSHSLALRTNGTLWAWGLNDEGQLGDGTKVNRCSPVSVIGGITNWSEIAAGGRHSVTIRKVQL